MKKIIALITIACAAICAQAQTNSTQTYVDSVENYFSGFNTNYGWGSVKLEVITGYKQVPNENAASDLEIQYNFNTNWFAIGTAQFSGIGSAINGGEVGGGYVLLSKYDTKLEASLLAGYDDTKLDSKGRAGSFVIEPSADVKKLATTHTFVEAKIGFPVYTVGRFNTQPTLYALVGATF